MWKTSGPHPKSLDGFKSNRKEGWKALNIHAELEQKGNKIAPHIAAFVQENPSWVPELLTEMQSPTKKAKNGAAKALRIVSEKAPELLYPHFDQLARLLGQNDTILKWIGIDVVGNLSFVDREDKIDSGVLRPLYTFLSDRSMITASHAIEGLGKIARNKPRFRNEITRELLKTESIERSDECRNILLGRTVLSYSTYFDKIEAKGREDIISFVCRHQSNPRNATRKKAQEFLKKLRH